MKITVDMENLSDIVEKATTENIKETVERVIRETVKEKVSECLKEDSENYVSDAIHRFVDEYIQSQKITVGNGLEDEGAKEYTIEQYIKKKIKDSFEEGVFTREVTDRWSGKKTREKISFQSYLDNHFNVEIDIKKHIDKFAEDMRYQVNKKIKETLDNSMKTALTDSIFNMLSCSNTYQNVMRNVQLLGDSNG